MRVCAAASAAQTEFLFAAPPAVVLPAPAQEWLHDARCRDVVRANPNMLVPWVLSAAFAYEHLSTSIISDGLYDDLCQQLAQRWAEVSHVHKRLLNPEWFPKGSIPLPEDAYPARIVGATRSLISNASESVQ